MRGMVEYVAKWDVDECWLRVGGATHGSRSSGYDTSVEACVAVHISLFHLIFTNRTLPEFPNHHLRAGSSRPSCTNVLCAIV